MFAYLCTICTVFPRGTISSTNGNGGATCVKRHGKNGNTNSGKTLCKA